MYVCMYIYIYIYIYIHTYAELHTAPLNKVILTIKQLYCLFPISSEPTSLRTVTEDSHTINYIFKYVQQ